MKRVFVAAEAIVVGNDSFKQEKVWFGYEAEVSEGESVGDAIATIRLAADDWEKAERELHAKRTRDRRMGR